MGWTFSTPGMLEPPTLDLSKPRPRVRNSDGSISTIRSMGVGFDGKQYLIPTVSEDGRSLSAEEAIDEFKRTHKHLGVYDSVENSNKAAEKLHEQQATELDKDRPWWQRPLGRSLEGLAGFTDIAAIPFEAGYALAGKEAPTFTGSSKWVREKFDLPPVSEDTGLANRVTGLTYQMVGGPVLEQLAAKGAGLAGRVAKNIIPEHRPRTVQIKPPRPAGDNSWVTPEIRRQYYAEQDWGKNRPYLFKFTTRREGIEAGALSPVGPRDAYAEVRSGKDYDQLSPEAKRLYDMRANSDEVIGEPVTRKGSLDIDEAQWWQPEEPLGEKAVFDLPPRASRLLWSEADESPPAPVPGSIQIKPPRPARTKRDIWLEADPSTWGDNVRLVPVHSMQPQDYGYGPPDGRYAQFDVIHPSTGELIGRISGTLDYTTGDFNIGSTGAESASRVIAALGPRNPAWRDEYRSGLAGDRAGLYGPRRVRALAEHLKAWMPELKTISSTSRVTGVRGRLGGDARVKPLTVRVRPGTPDYVPRPRKGSLDLTEQELITFESPERVVDPTQPATRNDLMSIENSIERSLRIEPGRRRLADDERNMEYLMGRFAHGELDPDAIPTSPEREALIEQVHRRRTPRTATGMTLDEAIRDRDTTGVDFNDTPGGIDPITGNPRERPPYPNDLLSTADLEDMERRAAAAASPPRRPITTGNPEEVLNELEAEYAAAMRIGDTDQMRRLGDQWDLAWRRAYGGSGSPGLTIDEAVAMRTADDDPQGSIDWNRYLSERGQSRRLPDDVRSTTDRYVDEQLSAQERDLNPEAAQHEDNIVAQQRRREAALEADRTGGASNRFGSEQRDIDRSFERAENQLDEIQNTGELSPRPLYTLQSEWMDARERGDQQAMARLEAEWRVRSLEYHDAYNDQPGLSLQEIVEGNERRRMEREIAAQERRNNQLRNAQRHATSTEDILRYEEEPLVDDPQGRAEAERQSRGPSQAEFEALFADQPNLRQEAAADRDRLLAQQVRRGESVPPTEAERTLDWLDNQTAGFTQLGRLEGRWSLAQDAGDDEAMASIEREWQQLYRQLHGRPSDQAIEDVVRRYEGHPPPLSDDIDEATMQLLHRQGFPHWEEPMSAMHDDPRWHQAELNGDEHTAQRLTEEYMRWQERFDAIRDSLREGRPAPTFENHPRLPVPPAPQMPPRELNDLWDRQFAPNYRYNVPPSSPTQQNYAEMARDLVNRRHIDLPPPNSLFRPPRGWENTESISGYRYNTGSAIRDYKRQRALAETRASDKEVSQAYRNDMNALREAARLHQETGQPQMLPADGMTPPRMLVTIGDYRAEIERIYGKLLGPDELVTRYSGEQFRPGELAERVLQEGGITIQEPRPTRQWTTPRVPYGLKESIEKLLKR